MYATHAARIYISYFAGENGTSSKTLTRALCFVLGFTAVFTSLGLFAGTLGVFLATNHTGMMNEATLERYIKLIMQNK